MGIPWVGPLVTKAGVPGIRALAFFLFAPTLVFSHSFPRAARRDWFRICRLSLQIVAVIIFDYVFALQFMLPSLLNTVRAVDAVRSMPHVARS